MATKASGIRLNVDNADLAIAQRLDPLMSLTPPQRRFCEAYMRTGNAAESARQAGYAKSSAGVTGNRLLNRDDIQQALQELWISQAISSGMTVDRLVAELSIVAMNREHKDQLKAIDMLMRYMGAYDDRLTISLDDPDIIEMARVTGVEPSAIAQELGQLGIQSPASST